VSAERAYVGIGSNLGNRIVNVERALGALERLGRVVRRSSLYFTRPWGRYDQPWFYNAVALLETELPPRALLDALKALEQELGRGAGERWGPRTIDLDLLLYGDVETDEPGLRLPHPRLSERAFVLVPLAEIDDRFARLRDALDAEELAGVVRAERETAMAMPNESLLDATERVRSIARFLRENELTRVRVQRGDDEIVVAAGTRPASPAPVQPAAAPQTSRVDAIKADLVGVFRLSRPEPAEGDAIDADRELGYIEALGIRTPIHATGAGRIVSIEAGDGSAVEYGQPLFLVARGS